MRKLVRNSPVFIDSDGMNVEGDKLDDEGANEEDDADELYRDVNINLEGQQQSSSMSSRFVLNMLNQSPDTGIDFIFNLNNESTHRKDDSRRSFNKLMDTPLDFSAFVMNRLKVDTPTPKLLAGLTYELMKGSCKSLVELEFFLEEAYK
nr:hypothetical protein [Tanacetum cinerariifolium]